MGMRDAKRNRPSSVGAPTWSVLIFVVTVTPCIGPPGSPLCCAASARSAANSASSPSTRVSALTLGLTAAMRSSVATAIS